MIVVVLLSPVVWPWYLAAGFALVAASGMGRWRPTYVVLIVAASAVVCPTSVAPVKSLNPYQHVLTMLVVALIALGCWAAQRMATYWAARRADLELAVVGAPTIDPRGSADRPHHPIAPGRRPTALPHRGPPAWPITRSPCPLDVGSMAGRAGLLASAAGGASDAGRRRLSANDGHGGRLDYVHVGGVLVENRTGHRWGRSRQRCAT